MILEIVAFVVVCMLSVMWLYAMSRINDAIKKHRNKQQ